MNLLFLLGIVMMSSSIVFSISKDTEIKMIADVLKSFYKPSNVIANLCWKSSSKKQLSSHLAMSDDPKSIKFTHVNYTRDLLRRETIIFLTDLNCPEAVKVVRQGNFSNTYAKPYRWFIIGSLLDGNDTVTVPAELDDLRILPDSEVYITQYNGNNTYSIYMIYKIKQHLNYKVESYGNWNDDVGLIKSKVVIEQVTAMRRRNLERESIISSMVITDNGTLADLENLKYPQIDPVSKAGYVQLTSLYEFINATRQFVYTDIWGYYINGSWTGTLGDLDMGRADLSGSVMFVTKSRMNVVEYLSHPTPTSVSFIFREPPLSYQNNLYLLPFRTSVWYCIGSFVVLLVLLIYVNAYWEEQKMETKNEKEPVRKAIYEQKIAPSKSTPRFYDLDEGVRQLQTKPFAFNCNLGAAYRVMEKYFYEHEKCGLQEITYIQESSAWQSCKKGSPYLEIFKIGLLRNSEFGLNDRTNRRLFSKKPICSTRGGSFVSVSLVDCYPSLLLLLYGMILGVVLLIAELIYHRRNRHKEPL